MVVRERFTVKELVARTRVPPATVHHYLRQGILPPPRRLGPTRFEYDDRHVQALRLIRLLRQRRKLPLRVIKRILPSLLALEGEQAFRPQMWDEILVARGGSAGRRGPEARLLEAAKEAFAQRGYGDVNVDDLCARARIAKGSFYRYYQSKEQLFFAAAESAAADAAADFLERTPGGRVPASEALQAMAAAVGPVMPIFLDLLARALQRRPGYRAAARTVVDTLAAGVAERLRSAQPRAEAQGIVTKAVGAVLRDLLAPAAGEQARGAAGA